MQALFSTAAILSILCWNPVAHSSAVPYQRELVVTHEVPLVRRPHPTFANEVVGTPFTWVQVKHIMYLASPTTPVIMIAYNEDTGFTVLPLILEKTDT
jgi:hypothetical protein